MKCKTPTRPAWSIHRFPTHSDSDTTLTHTDLGLLCVADGAEFHLFRSGAADDAAAHTGCILRPPSLCATNDSTHALHTAWAPDTVRPQGLLAVAWTRSLGLYRITREGEGRTVAATKLGEVRLERKLAGLAWHPAACVPLLAIHDITDVTLVQLPRGEGIMDGGSERSYYGGNTTPYSRGTAPRTPTPSRYGRDGGGSRTPSAASGPVRASCTTAGLRTPSRAAASVVMTDARGSSSCGFGTIKVTSVSPSLPGALEAIAWSQRGRHLAVCMEGVLRVYDWPAARNNDPLAQLDLSAMPYADTKLWRRVRAIHPAGPRAFAAVTDMDLIVGSGSALAGKARSPAVPEPPPPTSSSSLHLIHVANATTSGSGSGSRLHIDVETAAVAHLAMPDLLAVKPVGRSASHGEPATHALAAVGSHASDAIAVFRLSAHAGCGGTGAAVALLFTAHLPPCTRPKGLAFVGSRLVVLTGVRDGATTPALNAATFGEFRYVLLAFLVAV